MTFTAELTAKEWLEWMTGYQASEPTLLKYVAKACWLALLTGTPGTGGCTIKKVAEKEVLVATTTGYTRHRFESGGDKLTFTEVAGTNSYMENTAEDTVCTGLGGAESVVTAWALLGGAAVTTPKSELGYVAAWGTCTATGIGPTQTPVKLGAGKMKVEVI